MIILEEYSSSWPRLFFEEVASLKKAFYPLDISFYHIGSTSIPFCKAKPVIDILGVIHDVLLIDDYAKKLSDYDFLGEFGMKQRRFFKKSHSPVNLHIFEDTDPEVGRHLRFCDYLRQHPDKRKKYVSLKEELTLHDREEYTLGKSAFVKEIDRDAAIELTTIYPRSNKRKIAWSNKEIISALEVNFGLHMTYFSKYINRVELVFNPDVTILRSTIAHYNCALGARFAKEAKKRVKETIEHFNPPFSWWVSNLDTPKSLSKVLEDEGLHLESEKIGMYLEVDNHKPKTTDLSFKRVLDEKQLIDFPEFLEVPPLLYAEEACLEIYAGYLANRQVTSAALLFHANVAGIYFIDCEKYKSEMINYLLCRTKEEGFKISILFSSESDKPIYTKLGYKEVWRIQKHKSSVTS